MNVHAIPRPAAGPSALTQIGVPAARSWRAVDGHLVIQGVDLDAERVAAGLAGIEPPLLAVAETTQKALRRLRLRNGDVTPALRAAILIAARTQDPASAPEAMTLWLLAALDGATNVIGVRRLTARPVVCWSALAGVVAAGGPIGILFAAASPIAQVAIALVWFLVIGAVVLFTAVPVTNVYRNARLLGHLPGAFVLDGGLERHPPRD